MNTMTAQEATEKFGEMITVVVIPVDDAPYWHNHRGDTLDMLHDKCGGWVDVIRMYEVPGVGSLDLWVNDESLINGMEPNRAATRVLWAASPAHMLARYIVHGPAVLALSTTEGETVSVTRDIVQVFEETIGLHVDEVQLVGREYDDLIADEDEDEG